MKVWIDGQIVDGESAAVSVRDHGLLYGDGVFEGIRAWNGRVFRLDDHLERLSYGAKALHLELPLPTQELARVVVETVAAHGDPESYIRLVVTRGIGPLGIDIANCEPGKLICMVDTLRIFPKEQRLSGISLATVSQRRPRPDTVDPRVKSLNYLNNVLARIQAKRANADSALILNTSGMIAEADVANVFVLRGGALQTPPTTDGSLDGITRRTVMELAEELGVRVEVRSLSRIDMLAADDAFLSGTGSGIVRINQLDGQQVGRGEPSETVSRLIEGYTRRTGHSSGG